jgi:phosphomannomutase
MTSIDSSIFKAYDIRGIYPTQINVDLVYKIAQAYAKFLKPKTVVVGYDMRLTGKEFSEAAIRSLNNAGVNVIDIGLVSTDQLYFAAATLNVDGGIQVTASHNPKEFGGLKLVQKKGKPISGDSGIYQIRDLVISNFQSPISKKKGSVEKQEIYDAYYKHVLKFFDIGEIKPLKIVANANFGMANPAIEKLKTFLPVEFIKVIDNRLDGSFPKGPSDPLLPSNRPETIAAIKELKPDLGVAWDGDADRCFFFDETGEFVTPAYINALLSGYYLKKYPRAKILHDTRVVRVIDYVIEQNGGKAIMAKAGHSFIKERMIKDGIVFGTETSGHYFFRDNFYLDNGLMPFLAVLEIISAENKTFSEILKPLREKFYISEEINFELAPYRSEATGTGVTNPKILDEIKNHYQDAQIDNVDGFDFNYPSWRFNLRVSNTQNLLRLNVEADSKELLEQKIDEVTDLVNKLK